MRHTNVGLLYFNKAKAYSGVTLISPLHGNETYLIGMTGEVLHKWIHPYKPGNYAYLLPTGNLLWAAVKLQMDQAQVEAKEGF